MLGNSGVLEISGGRRENEMGKSVTVAEERENERNEEIVVGVASAAAYRWPQEETLALLKIRSEMDVAFREPGSKAHLWDEVSRRMAELGYHRNSKKCKEKFENIYKYHKRLKTGSYARSNGKTYRFFNQLEALDNHEFMTSSHEQMDTASDDTTLAVTPISTNPPKFSQVAMPISVNSDPSPFTTSTSTTSSSGSESEGSRKKKRKWADFFDRLMKSVLEKQEDLQNKFLEAIDKCERERQEREEAWKLQEMARIKREHELLMRERSISAAKDAAVLSFLQKISEQGKEMTENPGQDLSIVCRNERENGESSSSRWPKEEVEALIRIRSNLELEYQRIGPKGPLWEDISGAMKKIGYERSAKRCKEKWENINKYYRRVKDSSKRRPIDSKTCPYFHLLDSLYNMKAKRLDNNISESSGCNIKPEELLMHMMNHHSGQLHQQEQVVLQQEQGELITNHKSGQNCDHNQDEEAGNDHSEYAEGLQETVANDPSPMNIME